MNNEPERPERTAEKNEAEAPPAQEWSAPQHEETQPGAQQPGQLADPWNYPAEQTQYQWDTAQQYAATGQHQDASQQWTQQQPDAQYATYSQEGQYAPGGNPQGNAPSSGKGLSKGALFGIIGGAALVVLIIIAAIWAFMRPGGGIAGLGSESPSESVESYLTALSQGDAEGALAYVESYEADVLLAEEVLQKSNELSPISDIAVEEAVETGRDQYRVSTSFNLGDRQIERTFEVWDIDEPIIYDGLARFSLPAFEGLGLTVNGVEYSGEATSVFPGAYELGLSIDGFEVAGQEGPLLIGSSDDAQSLYELAPAPTEETVQTFREMVTASLNECLESKALSTDCGMDVSDFDQDGYSVIDGTVERSLSAEGEAALKKLEVRSNYEIPVLLESSDFISIDMTLEAESGSQRAEYELLWGGELGTPSIDFSDENPAVRWD